MLATELQKNIFLPYALLFIITGIYALSISKFAPFRHYLLSLKILSGALDQKSKNNRLAPFSAMTLGRLFENTISAIIANWLVFMIYGPGIWGWLLLTLPLAMSLDFSLGTLSHKFTKSIVIEGRGHYQISNPTTLVSHFFRSSLLGGIFAGLMLAAALFQGVGIPMFALHSILELNDLGLPVGTALIFICILLICGTGNIQRIARISKIAGFAGIILTFALLLILFFLPNQGLLFLDQSGTFFNSILNDFMPKNFEGWVRLLVSLGIYWALTGIGSAKAATYAGTIRTQYSAKAGLAVMATTPLSVILISPIVFIMAMVLNRDLGFQELLKNLNALTITMFFLLTISGISGWVYLGRQTLIFFFRKFRYGVFIVLMSLAFLLCGIYLQFGHDLALRNILYWTVIISALPGFLLFITLILASHVSLHEWRRYKKSLESKYEIIKDFLMLVFHLVPKNLISRVFGWLSYIPMPGFIRVPVITAFAKLYAIDLDETEGHVRDYPSLNKFFTRALRDGVRLVAHEKNTLVSPVDGRMSQFGPIKLGTMIQSKGLTYTASDLLDGSAYEDAFDTGNFCVLYLSPQDYHRIHSPYEGQIVGYSYHPGQLFPVNSLMVNGLSGLFPKNERLTTFLKTKNGMIAVIKVGATNVGRIRVCYDDIRSNKWFRRERHVLYNQPIDYKRGQELGRFEMGSTVILLMENKDFSFLDSFVKGNRVRYGQILGKFG